MAKTVASYLVEMMIEAGVRNVYGIVGDSANPITDAMRRSGGKLNFVNVRHEEATGGTAKSQRWEKAGAPRGRHSLPLEAKKSLIIKLKRMRCSPYM